MSKNRVLCEIEPDTRKIIRILRFGGTALFLKPEQVMEYPKAEAVKLVRKRVYEIARGECRNCGRAITWHGFHMHEQKPRGAGGEISVTNSVALCAACHIGGKNSEHGNRSLRFGK